MGSGFRRDDSGVWTPRSHLDKCYFQCCISICCSTNSANRAFKCVVGCNVSANMKVWSAPLLTKVCGEQNSDEPNMDGLSRCMLVAFMTWAVRSQANAVFDT